MIGNIEIKYENRIEGSEHDGRQAISIQPEGDDRHEIADEKQNQDRAVAGGERDVGPGRVVHPQKITRQVDCRTERDKDDCLRMSG